MYSSASFGERISSCVTTTTGYRPVPSPTKIYPTPLFVNYSPQPLSLATPDLFFISLILPFPECPIKGNYVVYGLLNLTSFPSHNAFEIHLYYCMCQQFVSFHCFLFLVAFHCMDVLWFVFVLPIHHLKDVQIVSSFQQLQMKMPHVAVTYRFLYECLFSFLLDKCLGIRIAGSYGKCVFTLEEAAKLFPKCLYHFALPTAMS